ncbi:MAG: hypothetical protein Q8O00_06365 [Holophaga sp.]|nr:hypothetical protein [Holophaga sp.]
MALFGFGKEKREGGNSDLVLAYLEDAQRVRTPFILQDKRKLEHHGVLQALDEESGTMNLQVTGSYAGDKGSQVDMVFVHEGLRLGATARLVEVRGSTVVVEIPEDLSLSERRKQARARLNAKEGATLTGLTSLFEGVGITGTIENISETGCRVRVEKALNIKDQKKLGIGSALVSVGHAFMILKLNKVPRCPAVMELDGKVAYVDDKSGGLVLGLLFEKSEFTSALKSLVANRAGSIPSAVPPKARRKAVIDGPNDEPYLAAKVEKRVDPPPPKNVEPSTVIEPVPPAPLPPAPLSPVPSPVMGAAISSPPSQAPGNSRTSPLQRMKKRSRSMLILSSAGHGTMLQEFFQEEGYGRIHLAVGWDEVVAQLQPPGVNVLMVDTERPVLESLEMVQRLKDAGLNLPPIVLAADEISRALVIAAQRVGVAQLLVKPYSLDETLSNLIEQQVGLA